MERGRLSYSGILIFEMLWVVCMAQAAYILLLTIFLKSERLSLSLVGLRLDKSNQS